MSIFKVITQYVHINCKLTFSLFYRQIWNAVRWFFSCIVLSWCRQSDIPHWSQAIQNPCTFAFVLRSVTHKCNTTALWDLYGRFSILWIWLGRCTRFWVWMTQYTFFVYVHIWYFNISYSDGFFTMWKNSYSTMTLYF